MNTIEWTKKAFRDLRKIGARTTQNRIYAAVEELTAWPDCSGDIKRLQGSNDYRLRVGQYRVIFQIDQRGTPIIITITTVSIRNESTY
ncbi:MAG: type II toxin-antitoxin system RelE/ParE family toxin [Burkholderiales bacterium]|jgi:mRNA interferase RelE/StbE|nr:type II toxin-antitoxin system RelE/ParE family toxin [Burkholderiales bacterium]